MPKHGMIPKWTKLASDVGWRGEIMDLQRFVLEVIIIWPDAAARSNFLEYYYDEKNAPTASNYNHLVQLRSYIKALLVAQETDLTEFSMEELMEMARG